jgi:hypothetical protein
VRGALAGIEGTLLRAKSESHLLISIDMIQQSLAVSVSPGDVERIGGELLPADSIYQEA